jgi:hypothetical protein
MLRSLNGSIRDGMTDPRSIPSAGRATIIWPTRRWFSRIGSSLRPLQRSRLYKDGLSRPAHLSMEPFLVQGQAAELRHRRVGILNGSGTHLAEDLHGETSNGDRVADVLQEAGLRQGKNKRRQRCKLILLALSVRTRR